MSLETALEYAYAGWAVFPLLPRSKAPACLHGFRDASSDENAIKLLWGYRTNLNVGIATGAVSGFWVLDIDPGKGGDKSLDDWENKYGSLPRTLTSKTGGGGKHYFFKIPLGVKIPSSANKLSPGIDIRGEGGYIAAPPSIHPNGTMYDWSDPLEEIADAPQWLIKLIIALKPPAQKQENKIEPEGDWTSDDVISMLDCISPDEREIWIKVGMSLHDSGWPVSMWDSWSRGSEKYKMGEPFRIWNGFKSGSGVSMGTLVHMAQSGGWEPKQRPYEALDFSNIGGVDLSDFRTSINKVLDIPELKTKIEIGGLVGDTLSWINSTAFKLQPELSIMNTIAALGAVFGRRYALQKFNTRTNVYMVGIAETGQGKDNSRQQIKKLLKLAELDNFSGPDEVRSGPGLMLELKKRPSFLANIDEIGMFMRALFDQKAPSYIREISSMFTKLYSCSGTSYEGGLIASQPDQRTVLHEPNLCIYGTTTLSSYAEAMRRSSIVSGELNRFIVLKSAVEFPEPNFNSDSSDPPESLVSRWKQFKLEGLNAAPDIIEQEKITVLLGNTTEIVNELYRFQDKMIEENRAGGLGALWVRYRENILKIAMIIAIARDYKKPVLIANDIEFGKSLVGSSIRFMMKFAAENMYDSDFQKRCSEFMVALSKGVTTRTRMNTHLRIKPKELDEIERALKEMDKIGFDEKERPRKYFMVP